MGKLTGTQHGEAANSILAFYEDKVIELEQAGQYFMAAIALGLALESAEVLTYLLVEFGDDNGGRTQDPALGQHVSELVDAANEIDVLTAPVDIPSHGRDGDDPPKHVAKDVVDKIRRFRNLIHPARALKEGFDPRAFTQAQLQEFKEMYSSVTHSLLYYL